MPMNYVYIYRVSQKKRGHFQNYQTPFSCSLFFLPALRVIDDALKKVWMEYGPPKSFPYEIIQVYVRTCKN